MTDKERFEKIGALIQLHIEGRKTGKIKFESIEQKAELGRIYKSLYKVNPQLSCDTCVRFYLDQLEAYHQREYPKFLLQNTSNADLKDEDEAIVSTEKDKPAKPSKTRKIKTKK